MGNYAARPRNQLGVGIGTPPPPSPMGGLFSSTLAVAPRTKTPIQPKEEMSPFTRESVGPIMGGSPAAAAARRGQQSRIPLGYNINRGDPTKRRAASLVVNEPVPTGPTPQEETARAEALAEQQRQEAARAAAIAAQQAQFWAHHNAAKAMRGE